jgi:hypothetical protein
MISSLTSKTLKSNGAKLFDSLAWTGWLIGAVVIVCALWPQFGNQVEDYSVSLGELIARVITRVITGIIN